MDYTNKKIDKYIKTETINDNVKKIIKDFEKKEDKKDKKGAE